MVDFGVEDLGDLKLWFAINFHWRWRWLSLVGDGIGDDRFKLRHMEDWVNCTHRIWEAESKG